MQTFHFHNETKNKSQGLTIKNVKFFLIFMVIVFIVMFIIQECIFNPHLIINTKCTPCCVPGLLKDTEMVRRVQNLGVIVCRVNQCQQVRPHCHCLEHLGAYFEKF